MVLTEYFQFILMLTVRKFRKNLDSLNPSFSNASLDSTPMEKLKNFCWEKLNVWNKLACALSLHVVLGVTPEQMFRLFSESLTRSSWHPFIFLLNNLLIKLFIRRNICSLSNNAIRVNICNFQRLSLPLPIVKQISNRRGVHPKSVSRILEDMYNHCIFPCR